MFVRFYIAASEAGPDIKNGGCKVFKVIFNWDWFRHSHLQIVWHTSSDNDCLHDHLINIKAHPDRGYGMLSLVEARAQARAAKKARRVFSSQPLSRVQVL